MESTSVLFVDDEDVLYRAGTRLEGAVADRHPDNPLIPAGERSWESLLGWCSAFRDPREGRHLLWYQAFNSIPSRDPMSSVVCVATSADGVEWHAPELNHHQVDGNPTNIVIVGNGGHSHRYCCCAIEDPNRIFGDRLIMGYFDFARGKEIDTPGMHLAHSEDGLEWTPVPGAPFAPVAYGFRGVEVPRAGEPCTGQELWHIPLTMSDATDFFYDPMRKCYCWYGKMWLDGPDGRMGWKHGLGYTTSTDLVHWEDPKLVLWPDDQDPEWVEFHTGPVFVHEGIYFCLLQILNRGERAGVLDIELAVSRDGERWLRPFRSTRFIGRGDRGAFDGGSILTNSTPVVLDDEIRFYYGGYSAGATGTLKESEPVRSGIGLASVSRDRFASISTLDGPGQITLKPRRLPETGRLAVNADAAKGEIRVELLNERGYRIPGYERENCRPVREDDLHIDIGWAGRNRLPPGDVMIRIYLTEARVFALYLG